MSIVAARGCQRSLEVPRGVGLRPLARVVSRKPQVSAAAPAGHRPHLYNELVDVTSTLAALTAEQEAWAQHSEALWRRAHALADAHAGLDAGDIYHALRCLELSPAERLRRGLSRGQLRTHAR